MFIINTVMKALCLALHFAYGYPARLILARHQEDSSIHKGMRPTCRYYIFHQVLLPCTDI